MKRISFYPPWISYFLTRFFGLLAFIAVSFPFLIYAPYRFTYGWVIQVSIVGLWLFVLRAFIIYAQNRSIYFENDCMYIRRTSIFGRTKAYVINLKDVTKIDVVREHGMLYTYSFLTLSRSAHIPYVIQTWLLTEKDGETRKIRVSPAWDMYSLEKVIVHIKALNPSIVIDTSN